MRLSHMNDELSKDVRTPLLEDLDYFFPDNQLIIYYKKLLAGLEQRFVSVKQKIEDAEKRIKEDK